MDQPKKGDIWHYHSRGRLGDRFNRWLLQEDMQEDGRARALCLTSHDPEYREGETYSILFLIAGEMREEWAKFIPSMKCAECDEECPQDDYLCSECRLLVH